MTASATCTLTASLANRFRVERRRYRQRLERCQRKFSESAVHDLRIETRRLLALLDLLRALHFPGPIKKTRKMFKQRLDAFDGLRDTQVQLSLLRPLWRQYPEAHELETWLDRRARRLTDELRQHVHATKGAHLEQRLKSVEKQLRKAANKMPPGTMRSAIQDALRVAFERVAMLRGQIRRERTATIHRTRVAFKRFRYLCELLRPTLPEFKAEKLARMRDYQTMMGDIQDLKVMLAGMRHAVAEREISARAIGPLRRELQRRQRESIATYLADADSLAEFEPERPPSAVVLPAIH
jgi:CHAD domain-containing protein